MMKPCVLAIAALSFSCLPTRVSDGPPDDAAGEGEGAIVGEGEGEGSIVGEGEGEGGRIPVGEGEGSAGEGEGSAGEGEGEGAVATTCTSGHHWLLGDLKTELMHPGRSCIECHATHSGAPQFQAAGTVMGGLHDEDDCHGVSGVTVRVTGADGAVQTASTNFNGNFSFDAAIATPYHAEIEVNGQVRQMATAQTEGDCMSCHTQGGAHAAPGRIVIPGVTIPQTP